MSKHSSYIVDGFNLGYKVPSIARLLKAGKVQEAILRITHFVHQAVNKRTSHILIVFDGQWAHLLPPSLPGGVQLIFSRTPQSADDVIRHKVRSLKNPRDWAVITSDQEIIHTARQMGAAVIRSETFARSALEKVKTPTTENEAKYNPQNVDLDYWLKQFGANSGEE